MENTEHNNLERSIGRLEGKLDSTVFMMTSISNDVSGLRNDFATMEKGRLTALEVKFAGLSSEMKVKARNSAMLAGAIISIAVSVISAIIIYFVTH